MLFTVNIHGPLCDTSSDPADVLETAVARAFPGSAVTVNLELPEPESRDSLLRTLTIVLDAGPCSGAEYADDDLTDVHDVDFADLEAAGA